MMWTALLAGYHIYIYTTGEEAMVWITIHQISNVRYCQFGVHIIGVIP